MAQAKKMAIWPQRHPSGRVEWVTSCPLCPGCPIIYRGVIRESAMREAAAHWWAAHDTRTSDARQESQGARASPG